MSNNGVPKKFNRELWERIIDRFCNTTGISVRIMDIKGNDWAVPKRPEFCEIMRNVKKWDSKCKSSDFKIAEKAWEEEKPFFSECHSGLAKFAIPLFICNKKVVLMGEHVLTSQEEKEEKLLQYLGKYVNNTDYIKAKNALQRVDVIPGLSDKRTAYMFARILDQVRLRSTLEEITKAISTIPLKFNKVLDLILEFGLELIAQPNINYIVHVAMLDEENKELFNTAVTGLGNEYKKVKNFYLKLGEGIVGHVAEAEKIYICNDVTKDDRYIERFGEIPYKIKSEFAVPLICGKKVIGVINFEADKKGAFSTIDKRFFIDFAGQAAAAIRNAQLYEQTQILVAALKEFNLFWEKTKTGTPLKVLLNLAVSIIAKALGAEICSLYLVDQESNDLVLQATTKEENEHLIGKTKREIGEGFTGEIAKNRNSIRINHGLNNIGAFLGLPLLKGSNLLGVIRVINKRKDSLLKNFTKEDEKLLKTLAEELVLVIQNALMSDKIERMSEERIRREKLASLGEMAGKIAHNILNPLGIIKASAEIAKIIAPKEDDLIEELDTITRNVDRVTDFRSRLLRFGAPSKTELTRVNINQEIKKALDLLKEERIMDGVELDFRFGDGLPDLLLVKNDIELVFVNMIRNSIEAMHGGGLLSVESRYLENDSELEVIIKDTGLGIPKELTERIFEPFVTSKKDGVVKGTGLGLSDSYNIIKSYGGSIRVESVGEGNGSAFTIILPCKGKNRFPDETEAMIDFLKKQVGTNGVMVNLESANKTKNMFENASQTAKHHIECFSKKTKERLIEDLTIARNIFYSKGDNIRIKHGNMVMGKDYMVNNNFRIVDEIVEKTEIESTTIFQNIGKVAIRISTTTRDNGGERAINTIVSEPVFQRTIKEGRTFIGRAWVVKSWQLTAYEPIKNEKDEIIGILYIGIPEKNQGIVDEMYETSHSWANFEEKGYVFVIDSKGIIIFHPSKDLINYDLSKYKFCKEILERKSGWIVCDSEEFGQRVVVRYRYFPDWDWIICATYPLVEILEMVGEVKIK